MLPRFMLPRFMLPEGSHNGPADRSQGPAPIMGFGVPAAITWIIGTAQSVFTIRDREISWRDLVLVAAIR